MGVEAGRIALAAPVAARRPSSFATTAPAYVDKTNATAIHAALGCDSARVRHGRRGAVVWRAAWPRGRRPGRPARRAHRPAGRGRRVGRR